MITPPTRLLCSSLLAFTLGGCNSSDATGPGDMTLPPGLTLKLTPSDYCAGFLRSFRYSNGAVVDQKDWGLTMGSVASFGVDIAGELYVLSGDSVLKLVQGA